jgi:hypothetical protein
MNTVGVTIRTARGAAAQQAALDAWLDGRRTAVDGRGLAVIAEGAFFELACPEGVALARLAPGCVCCVGAVPLRVTLTRMVRERRPNELLLLIATDEHLPRVRALLRDVQLGTVIEVQ